MSLESLSVLKSGIALGTGRAAFPEAARPQSDWQPAVLDCSVPCGAGVSLARAGALSAIHSLCA